MKQKELMIHY